MKQIKTKFSIDICGDCIYYPDCKIKKNGKPFMCNYSLTISKLKDRIEEWFKINIKKSK